NDAHSRECPILQVGEPEAVRMKRLETVIAGCVMLACTLMGVGIAASVPGKAFRNQDGHVSRFQNTQVIPVPSSSQAALDGLRANIQHIVFIIKENRSFDNYFGTFPGADGATSGVISTGELMPLQRTPDRTSRDLGHEWADTHLALDGGKMDRFDLVT